MKDGNKKKAESETGYMVFGMCLGMSFGAALGLVLFHNLAIGISAGMCVGMCIGMLADAGKKKSNAKETNQHDFIQNRKKKEEGRG
ncbi:MAG: hypothetical protein VZR73_12840 [Acutalibacteraceae bacterium]|nr:hypothetical protein [Acutalibacteraceae bacterium]